MKHLITIGAFVITGFLFGYWSGSDYCLDLLNRGLIYDEAPYTPPDILDGSRYGLEWGRWGSEIGLCLGCVIVTWRVRRNASRI